MFPEACNTVGPSSILKFSPHTDFGRVVPSHPSPLPWGEGAFCGSLRKQSGAHNSAAIPNPEKHHKLSPLPKGEG